MVHNDCDGGMCWECADEWEWQKTMTDTMIERMARAIQAEVMRPTDGHLNTLDWEINNHTYKSLAKAALDALEQPTEAMIETGMRYRLAVEKPNVHDTAGIFSAMIQAAKGESQ